MELLVFHGWFFRNFPFSLANEKSMFANVYLRTKTKNGQIQLTIQFDLLCLFSNNCHNVVVFSFSLHFVTSSTYVMGQNADFNLQLNDTRRRFTYFVPRDWAWQQTEIEFPSTHKKLFMPEFFYHVSGIFSKNKCLTHQEIEIGSGCEQVN